MSREVADLYREISNDTYDLGREDYVVITPTLSLRNDATVAHNLELELDTHNKKHSFWDLNSMMLSGDIKVITKDNESKRPNTINASVINNILMSLFLKVRFQANGVQLDVLEDLPSYPRLL